MNKLARIVDHEKNQMQAAVDERLDASHLTQAQIQGFELFGAISVVGNISRIFNAETFRALQHFRDSEGYKAYGYERFDDFLDKHPKSPMTKNQFYDRQQLLESEGDASFNVLNSLKIPFSKRKLLKGQVTVDGDNIHIGQDDNEQVVSLSDSSRIVEVILAYAEKNAEQTRTIERGKSDVEKWKRKAHEAGQNGKTDASPYEQAFKEAIAALVNLSAEAKALPNAARPAEADRMLRTVAPAYSNLMRAYRLDADESELSDDEVAGLMEE